MAQRGRPRKSVSAPAPIDSRSAKAWLERIERAKRVRQDWRDQMRVSLAYEYFEGRQRPPHIPENEWITINMVYSTLLAELPSLYSTDPYFYCKLKKSYKPDLTVVAEYEKRAQTRQAILNYYKGELDLKPKARMSIFDAHFQYGVFKVHLSADLDENPNKGKPILGDDERPLLGEDGTPLVEPDVISTNEMFRLTRLHPDDYLVDEDAGPLDEDVNWCAQRIKVNVDDFRADRRYPADVRKKVRATEANDKTQKEREQKKKGAAWGAETRTPDTVVLWEVYDRREKETLTIAEGHNDEFVLSPRPVPKGTEVDPFVDLRFTPRDDSWYPIPPISQRLDPQREYCETRSKMLKHRKRFNRKYEMYAGAYEDPEAAAAKLENGDDGTVLLKNQPLPSVTPVQDAQLDQNVHVEYAYLRKDFDDVATGANQRGSGMPAADSATEAGIIEKRTLIREGDRVGLVADFVTRIGRKLAQLVTAHTTTEMAVKIVGPQGEAWQTLRPEDMADIDGEFEYSINVGATTPQLPEIERAQWLSFLQLIATTPQLLLSKRLLLHTAKLHHIEDDSMVEELYSIGQMMLSGQLPMPGQQGSMPNTTGTGAARTGGMAGGANNVMTMRGGKQ